MVYSVDGIAGREARNAEKRLATHLAGKWNREYSQMVYYEGWDGNRCGMCEQPPHSWQPGSATSLAPPHPRWGCLRRLADLVGQVKASSPYLPPLVYY
jgi:hypothetical protein